MDDVEFDGTVRAILKSDAWREKGVRMAFKPLFAKKKETDGLQGVHTPFSLCKEMLTKLAESVDITKQSILVMFNLEFVDVLVRDFKVPADHITFFTDSPHKELAAKEWYGVSEEKTLATKKHFDVVVMNPPYQEQSDAQKARKTSFTPQAGIERQAGLERQTGFEQQGAFEPQTNFRAEGGSQAKPIYHLFIEQVIDEACPSYFLCVCPSRWMVGGMGLGKFRKRMTADRRIKMLVHFPGEREVFPDVSIKGGVSYFLWDKDYNGKCEFTVGGTSTGRFLNENDIVLQDNKAATIIDKVRDKVRSFAFKWMNDACFGNKPFGLATNFKKWQSNGTACYSVGHKKNYVANDAFTDKNGIIGKWKVCTSKATAEGASFTGTQRTHLCKVFLIEPGAICTETYIVVNVFDFQAEAENFVKYMKTKFFRFMLGLRLLTQDINKQRFAWVPDLGNYTDANMLTDEFLYDTFRLTGQERAYIESKIKVMK